MSERGSALWRRPPTWLLGSIAALLGWEIGMNSPGPGIDQSWNAGLAIAAHEGMQWGTEIVFSYGPLGFLQSQSMWFGDQAVLAFLFSAAVYVGFCIALVGALRRVLPAGFALLAAFLAVGVLPLIEQPLLLAALVALGLIERRPPPRTLTLLVPALAGFAAIEALVKLSSGPVIAVVLLLGLVGARARPWQLGAYVGLLALGALGLWLAGGQSLSAAPDFLANTAQIVSGYSTAMLRKVDVPAWKVTLATRIAAGLTIALVVAAALIPAADRRARLAAVGLVALVGFTLFKEGVVRTDASHLTLYFSSACLLWVALPWRPSGGPWWLLGGAAAIAVIGLPVRPPGLPTNLDAVANVRFAADQARTLLDGSRRQRLIDEGAEGMRATYRLDPRTRAALKGHSVAVEPWEVGAAWAYDLDWRPLPVFQSYSAYTAKLDRLNAEQVESPEGPERILRENQQLVFTEFPTADLDGRYPGWDPPEQARAVLCNFAPLRTTERWQVLGRVPDRCRAPRPVGSVEAGYGEAVEVPAPGPDEVVFVRIHGAGVGGLERLLSAALHARVRQIVIDGADTYRLVPETAGDGLLLRGGPRTTAGETAPFATIPQAKTIELRGASGGLRFDFYAMRVAPPASSRRPARTAGCRGPRRGEARACRAR
jgi:hypothetical protein